jgi:AraC-like DNA-binding protein
MADELVVSVPRSLGVASNPPGGTFGPRRLTDFEFVWMVRGGSRYRRDDAWYDVPEDAVVLCRPPCEDAFEWDPQRRSRHGFKHFHVEAWPEHWGEPAGWPMVRRLPERDVWRPVFGHLLALRGQGHDTMMREALGLLLSAFVENQLRTGHIPEPSLPEPVARAMRHLRRRLRDDPTAPLGLEDLAKAASVTPSHLCRLFKQATGRSPAQTVRLARLDRAHAMLIRSNEPVQVIAGECGFASPFHFSRRYRDAFGRSPSEVRQAVRQGRSVPMPLLHERLTVAS